MTTLTEQLLRSFGPPAHPTRIRQAGLGPLLIPAERHRAALSYAVLRTALGQLLPHFQQARIPAVLLKGEPLEELYSPHYRRGTGDLDLLILPGDLDAARQILRHQGYQPLDPDGPRMWSHNQQAFRHHNHGVIVELHWAVAEPRVGQLPVGLIIDAAEPYTFPNGLTVLVQRPDHLLLHLALHFHHHMGFARGLLDLAAWHDTYAHHPLWTPNARHLASEHHIDGLLQWPAWTIFHLTARKVSFFDPAAQPFPRYLARLSALAMRDFLTRPHPSSLRATLVDVMPSLPVLPSLLLQTLTMTAVDPHDRLSALSYPLLRGPHPLGRHLANTLFR